MKFFRAHYVQSIALKSTRNTRSCTCDSLQNEHHRQDFSTHSCSLVPAVSVRLDQAPSSIHRLCSTAAGAGGGLGEKSRLARSQVPLIDVLRFFYNGFVTDDLSMCFRSLYVAGKCSHRAACLSLNGEIKLTFYTRIIFISLRTCIWQLTYPKIIYSVPEIELISCFIPLNRGIRLWMAGGPPPLGCIINESGTDHLHGVCYAEEKYGI